MSNRWYIVHAYSNFEKKVAESIREYAAQRGLSEKFEEILVPTEQVVEVRRGRKVNSERKFFPGYVLVKCDLTDDVYHLIKNTPKVTGFLGADKKPMPISDAEADRIKGAGAGGRRASEALDPFRDRRDGARGGWPLRILQRRGRGSRRGAARASRSRSRSSAARPPSSSNSGRWRSFSYEVVMPGLRNPRHPCGSPFSFWPFFRPDGARLQVRQSTKPQADASEASSLFESLRD